MIDFNDFGNPQVAGLPLHLRQYIVDQHYEHYTPVDHAVWRYVMRQNYSHLKDLAYYPYIPGLKKAGLTIEHIPSLKDMNDALGKIGWGAVTVDGFIPPAAFMEFQANNVLVIAADIRQLKHIEYTPAPDIIHESAGHAPIIAEPEYNAYLSYFGSIGAKAMFSSRDFALYEAIRELSILKEMPDASAKEIHIAEEKVNECQGNMGEPSEMALLSRLHWWTVEYGLIGSVENPKIYGAGLLSSIGESNTCMSSIVKKIEYSANALNFPYDITKPQPQLFVTPDFKTLLRVLEDFADTMAFRKGGTESLLKAMDCGQIVTVVYSSGLQVSGTLTTIELDNESNPAYIKFSGPTALSYKGKELKGHDKYYHSAGFSSPVGRLKNAVIPLEDYTMEMLAEMGVLSGKFCELKFENGVFLDGKVNGLTIENGKLLLISFVDCSLIGTSGNPLFEPGWGTFDMAVGEQIISVFAGAADKTTFEESARISKTSTKIPIFDEHTKLYHQLFQQVRDRRERMRDFADLADIFSKIQLYFHEDWLCSLEILELLRHVTIIPELAVKVHSYLMSKSETEPELSSLITNGLRIADVLYEQNLKQKI